MHPVMGRWLCVSGMELKVEIDMCFCAMADCSQRSGECKTMQTYLADLTVPSLEERALKEAVRHAVEPQAATRPGSWCAFLNEIPLRHWRRNDGKWQVKGTMWCAPWSGTWVGSTVSD